MSEGCRHIGTLVIKVQDQFLARPGLKASPAAIAKRCRLDDTMCEAILDLLAGAKVLDRTADGAYRRALPDRLSVARRAA